MFEVKKTWQRSCIFSKTKYYPDKYKYNNVGVIFLFYICTE